MRHEEILVSDEKYQIKADLKIPENSDPVYGVVLAHGAVINRKSLSRITYCFAEYLCDNLGAVVITPDLMGETIHKKPLTFTSLSDVIDISVNHLCDSFNVESVMGFGHSMGSHILAHTVTYNNHIESLVNYGGPTLHILKNRQLNFLFYLIKYITSFNYRMDLRHIINNYFDVESRNFFNNVMMVENEFGYENYDYKLDPHLINSMMDYLTGYFENLKKWGKPTLLLFGIEDSLIKSALKKYPDGYNEDNITIQHIENACHATPCMDSQSQMELMSTAVEFYRKVHGIPKKEKDKVKATLLEQSAKCMKMDKNKRVSE